MAGPRIAVLLLVWLACPIVAAATGSVVGRVPVEAMPQPPAELQYRTRTRAPVLEPDPPRAVVYLERLDGTQPAPAPDTVVTVSQRGYQFRPAITVIPVGGSVRFPNEDDEFHSVFSYSSARRFDLGRFRKDEESPLVTFDEPGVVRVYCEIHKHMRGLIVVVDSPWYTTTDGTGSFRLDGIPPGRYTLHVLLASERTLQTAVEVSGDTASEVTLAQP